MGLFGESKAVNGITKTIIAKTITDHVLVDLMCPKQYALWLRDLNIMGQIGGGGGGGGGGVEALPPSKIMRCVTYILVTLI